MNDVMPEGWVPRIRGRRPLVDPVPALRKVQKNKGKWVVFDKLTTPEAMSLDRQLTKMGCLTSVQRSKTGKASVYGMWEDKQ